MKPLSSPALLLLTSALAAAPTLTAQNPTPVVNGVYVPEYKGSPSIKPGQSAVTPLQTELIGPLDI